MTCPKWYSTQRPGQIKCEVVPKGCNRPPSFRWHVSESSCSMLGWAELHERFAIGSPVMEQFHLEIACNAGGTPHKHIIVVEHGSGAFGASRPGNVQLQYTCPVSGESPSGPASPRPPRARSVGSSAYPRRARWPTKGCCITSGSCCVPSERGALPCSIRGG